ncbi:MAG: hypothetical protein ACD_79C00972G0010 [uncultured bacterium]|nr:MAG: hypothetical protein ACD_79C00972G0010 [uncultured bacterium]
MKMLSKSPWIIHYDGSSCNGCDIEVLACLTPLYDVERLGIINTGNPKHADILLITGSINEQNKEVVRNIYYQMPDPKVVIAIGICATSGGIFADCYNVMGGTDKVLPVDIYVPGCAARPESIIEGVAQSLQILEEKYSKIQRMVNNLGMLTIEPATKNDALEILELQKTSYRNEVELYNDPSYPPLTQTVESLVETFEKEYFLKAVMEGKIVGSVRARMENDTCYIRRLVVHPIYQNYGIGKRLIQTIEYQFRDAKRFEIDMTAKTKRIIFFFKKLGFKFLKKEEIDSRTWVYLEKIKSKE